MPHGAAGIRQAVDGADAPPDREGKVGIVGDAFQQVSGEMGELIESFFTTAMFGNSTVGFTVTTFWFLIACIIMLTVFFSYKKSMEGQLVPHGFLANGVEYLVEYVRDDVCKGNLGDTWKEHFPFLATLFFMVMFGDYVGMLPTWKAGTGTTGITGALALMSFCYFIVVGMKKKGVFGYIKSLAPTGLPAPIAAVVWVIEIFSTFLRLITLAVRLFCNMFAGHVAMGVFAIMTTTFIHNMLANFTPASMGLGAMSILWMVLLVLIYVVELLVAFIQAFVFTMLSSIYIGLSQVEHHHE